jgi:hypothetical protein
MPLPTLTKTWQYNVNQLLPVAGSNEASAKALLFAIKNSLCTFPQSPWTVVRSSNGAAVSNGDLWTSAGAFSVSYTLPSGGASARGWIVLKNSNLGETANGYQILIDVIFSNGVSWVGMFSSPGAGFTGGTTTARPTATDEHQLITNYNHGSPVGNPNWGYTNNSFGWTANKVYRFNAMMSTDGKCTRFWLVHDNAGTTIQTMCGIFDTLKNVPDGLNPTVSLFLASNASEVMAIGNFMYASGVEAQSLDFHMNEQPSRGNMTVEWPGYTHQTFANEITNEWPMWPIGAAILQTVDESASTSPIVTPGVFGRIGDFHDLWIGSTGVSSLDTYPGDGSAQFAQFNRLIVPWDGSTPLKS